MRSLQHASVQTKLTTLAMVTCVTGLLLASTGIITYELVTARQEVARQLGNVVDLIGASSTAALQSHDADAARQALSALRSDGTIEAARIDLPNGTALADYHRRKRMVATAGQANGTEDAGDALIVSREIVLDGRGIGSIRVEGNFERVHAQIRQHIWILSGVLPISCLLAFLLSSKLQRAISGPILRLSAVATRVSTERDYALRGVKESSDELGQLVDRFNEMLDQIEHRNDALQEAKAQLETRVLERTRILELEIVERRRMEDELILAKAAAEEASIAKSAFLANMSHELRTPLNAIIGYSEILREDAEEHGAIESVADVNKIINAGQHLLALITRVLDLSKIEAGRMELDVTDFDPVDLIQGAVATAETLDRS